MGAHYGAGSPEPRPRARTGPCPVLVLAERPRFLFVRPRPPRAWARQIRELMNEEQGQARSQSGDTGQPLTPLYCWGPHRGRAGQLAPGPEPVSTVSAPPACVQGWRHWEAVGKRAGGPMRGSGSAGGRRGPAPGRSDLGMGPACGRWACGKTQATWCFLEALLAAKHPALCYCSSRPQSGDSHEGWGQEEAGEKSQRL